MSNEDPKKNRRKSQVVHQIVERVEEKLSKGVEKATLNDYIKLVQLEKELEESEPEEESTITWVDPESLEE